MGHEGPAMSPVGRKTLPGTNITTTAQIKQGLPLGAKAKVKLLFDHMIGCLAIDNESPITSQEQRLEDSQKREE
jgi:hypothetical protein